MLAALALPAGASALPTYDGAMQFPLISSPSGPEEFSWEVELQPEEELKAIDDQGAAVFYSDGTQAFFIEAEPAHDATGASVPTTLAVVGPNIVTLTVHHRAGNPAAGGTPFVYPILAGAGYTTGDSTVTFSYPEQTAPSTPPLLHIPCSSAHGEVSAVKPTHCRVFGQDGTVVWLAFLRRLRWHDWDESVARATGLLLNPKTHARKHVRVLAFGSVECDGVRYYERMRLSERRSAPITIDISPC